MESISVSGGLRVLRVLRPAFGLKWGFRPRTFGDYRILRAVLVCLFFEACAGSNTYAQSPPTILETQKLATPDGSVLFGAAVAIDGELLVVGDKAANRATVFRLEDNQWVQEASLVPKNPVPGGLELFGFSVAVRGDLVAVGDVGAQSCLGVVYLFQRDAGGEKNWEQIGRLDPEPIEDFQFFGWDIRIWDDIAVVGAPLLGGRTRGLVYVFERDLGGAGKWGRRKTIFGPSVGGTPKKNDFGKSLGLEGGTLVIGAPEADDACPENSGCNSGAVFVHERNQGGQDAWGLVRKVEHNSPAQKRFFGEFVSLSGDRILVSSPGDSPFGQVFVRGRNEGGPDNWGHVAALSPSDATFDINFGTFVGPIPSVSIHGDTALVGAPADGDGSGGSGRGRGSVYLYRFDGFIWEELKLLASDGVEGDGFGSVAFDGATAVIGAWQSFGAGPGAAYTFELLEEDCDADGAVDLDDYADFEACLDGPDATPAAGCDCFDRDGDNDVDLFDFALFTLQFIG